MSCGRSSLVETFRSVRPRCSRAFLYLSIYLFYLSIYSISLSILSIYLFYLSIYSIFLSILSIYLFYLSIYLSTWPGWWP